MEDNDTQYFDAYNDLEVHERMLRDKSRNEAYKEAVFTNREYFMGKIVLDVGTGTGILSILCAKAGATKVYAVEASGIATSAKILFKENDVDAVVELIVGKVEDVQLPGKVDVIISEWMGFYLFHEAMLDSVLIARDRFLKEDGVLFPEKCELFVAPCRLPSLFSYWENVNDVKMKSFAEKLRNLYNRKPKVMKVSPDDLISEETSVTEFFLKYISFNDLNIISSRFFGVTRTDNRYQGICLWFTATFPLLVPSAKEVILSTSPVCPSTHWEQTVIVFQEDTEIEEGSLILGNLVLRRDITNPRFYNIEFKMLNPDLEDHPVPCNCRDTRCQIIKALSNKYDQRDMEMGGVD